MSRRAALAFIIVLTALPAAADVTYLDQGWSDELRGRFYYTPQGSQMMPYAWFNAIETADSERLFADALNLERYGLLIPERDYAMNPGGLPIGFALDNAWAPYDEARIALAPDVVGAAGDGRQVGLTCAACHTATVTVEGRPIRIDGAPAHFDFDSFYADLAEAVSLTLLDEERFERFAGRVLATPSLTGLAELKLRLAAFQVEITGDAAIRRPALASGFGRVDALTQIINSLAVRDQREPSNLVAPAAPTSFPPLWLTSQLEFVQWNPVAASPIGRNGGQVLGVFGQAVLTGPPEGWYASTMLLGELHELEAWIADLEPPRWDEELMGPIDADLAREGAELFDTNCAACHNMAPYRHTDPSENFFGETFIAIGRVDYRKVGTDPTYVETLAQRLVKTGPATRRLLDDQQVVPAAQFFLRTVGGVIARAMDEAGLTEADKAALNGFRLRPGAGGAPEPYTPRSLTELKASPLAGVWATGPYLHNGSVPTVYELLSPEGERRDVFWTGGRELDRSHLGFVSDDAPGRFRFDTSLPGNRNTGHNYPPEGLNERSRLAIIEYLKTQ